jgi:hypothetical protein
MKAALIVLGSVVVGLVLVLGPWPMPTQFEIKETWRRDGTAVATFYGRPAGLL